MVYPRLGSAAGWRSLALLLAASLTLSACATGAFYISAATQARAESDANDRDSAELAGQGIHGAYLYHKWTDALCRRSPEDPALALCRTHSRYNAYDPWRPTTMRYRRDADGIWQDAGPP